MVDTPLLDALNHGGRLRDLSPEACVRLAGEVRAFLTEVIGRTGGHLASNLGMVELTLALHRVFDFERDRLVFDVGHQCYTHKLLTGRRDRFHTIRQRHGLTGFPNPAESPCDPFVVGHASTSISSAVGLAQGYRALGEKRHVVVVIGDGAIGGGMCFEAINHAGHAREDVLVVLNDNDMSIAGTVGALSHFLTEIRSLPSTSRVRKDLHQALGSIPWIGSSLDWFQERMLDALKNHTGAAAVFDALGFRYFGPVDGHDLGNLEHELRNLSQLAGPRLLHAVSVKGRGFDAAAADPETYHSAVPFEIRGTGEVAPRHHKGPSYTGLFVEALLEAAKTDERLVAITAAMPAGTGIKTFAERYPERFVDVGITEAHAITFAGGLARAGLRPVVAIYSTFLQRGYDQIIHDVALQGDLPVLFMLDRAGLVGADGPTHHGVFDIAFLRHVPGMTLLAPRDGAELRAMLGLALTLPGPAAIRYPRGAPPDETVFPATRAPMVLGRAERIRAGVDGTVLAYGRMVEPSYEAAEALAAEGIELGVINARFAKPLDEAMVAEAAAAGPVLTVEDHALAGGFGSAVAEAMMDGGHAGRLTRIGIPDRFVEHGSVGELDELLGLDVPGLEARFRAAIQEAAGGASPGAGASGCVPSGAATSDGGEGGA